MITLGLGLEVDTVVIITGRCVPSKNAYIVRGSCISAIDHRPVIYLQQFGVSSRVLVSELSGQSNIITKVEESGMASAAELKASNIWRQRLGQVIESDKANVVSLS